MNKTMKRIGLLRLVLRFLFPLALILFIFLCRFHPAWAEAYARTVYPTLSAVLSVFASVFPFSLEEVLVVFLLLWMILFPFWKRRRGGSWRQVFVREVEVLAWVYIWFYLGWGLHYFRYNIYTRLQVQPAAYNEQRFLDFLEDYTERLNASYVPVTEVPEQLESEVKAFYASLPDEAGLTLPQSWQAPKYFTFTPLYSSVGVLGSMGPFFAEAQLNRDLLPVQVPFTYAHEFSHLLGVSNEAEANYWAYRVCTESDTPSLKYSGYLGLFPYVISNASQFLPKEDFQAWIATVRPEVLKDFKEKQLHWQQLYSPWVGAIQDYVYNLFLKGNQIPSGKKNYAEVISILLSLEPK